MIRIQYLIYIVPLLFAGHLRAQEENLSLSAALDKALQNNYGLIISRAEVEVAGINNSWGTAGRYPSIGFDASHNNNVELIDPVYTGRLSSGIGLDWILFDGFRVKFTKNRLENLEELTSGNLAVAIENTIEDIILSYYNVLLQKERLLVLKKVMDLSLDRYEYELKRQSLGGSVTYNVLQAQNVYLSDKASHLNQEVVVRNAIRNLNFMMAEDPGKTWTFEEPFVADTSSYRLDDLVSKMKSDNQILKNQYTNLLLQENQTSLQESAYYPTLSLGTGIDYTHSLSRAGGSSFTTNAIVPYGNIRLSFDIYQAGVRKRAMKVARINEEATRVEIQQMEHALTNELFNLYDYYNVRVELLNVADESLEAALLNLSISEEKYRSGVINSFNYRDIQLIYLHSAFQRLQAVYNLIDSRTQLTRITGGFLSGTEQDL
jgi:outer membrane protein TolC